MRSTIVAHSPTPRVASHRKNRGCHRGVRVERDFLFYALANERWLAISPGKGVSYNVSLATKQLMSSVLGAPDMVAARDEFCRQSGLDVDIEKFHAFKAVVEDRLLEATNPPRRELLASRTLIPGPTVLKLASSLTRLVDGRIAALNVFVGIAASVWLVTRGIGAQLPNLGAALIVFLATLLVAGLFHELGHAAAVVKSRRPTGPIGLGIYLIYPVFYTELYSLEGLPRRDRIWINIAGVHFQAICAGVIAIVSLMAASPVLGACAQLLYAMALFQLMPIGKSDGYWILRDALGGINGWQSRMLSAFTALSSVGLAYIMIRFSIIPLVSHLYDARDMTSIQRMLARPASILTIVQGIVLIFVALTLFYRIAAKLRRNHAAYKS